MHIECKQDVSNEEKTVVLHCYKCAFVFGCCFLVLVVGQMFFVCCICSCNVAAKFHLWVDFC